LSDNELTLVHFFNFFEIVSLPNNSGAIALPAITVVPSPNNSIALPAITVVPSLPTITVVPSLASRFGYILW